MQAHITQLYYHNRADYSLCGFIRKLSKSDKQQVLSFMLGMIAARQNKSA